MNTHNQQVDEISKCFYFVNEDKNEITIFNFDIYLRNVGIQERLLLLFTIPLIPVIVSLFYQDWVWLNNGLDDG